MYRPIPVWQPTWDAFRNLRFQESVSLRMMGCTFVRLSRRTGVTSATHTTTTAAATTALSHPARLALWNWRDARAAEVETSAETATGTARAEVAVAVAGVVEHRGAPITVARSRRLRRTTTTLSLAATRRTAPSRCLRIGRRHIALRRLLRESVLRARRTAFSAFRHAEANAPTSPLPGGNSWLRERSATSRLPIMAMSAVGEIRRSACCWTQPGWMPLAGPPLATATST
jgi:hypothetical protein